MLIQPVTVHGQDSNSVVCNTENGQIPFETTKWENYIPETLNPNFADLIKQCNDTCTMWCNTDSLNVRREPSLESEVLDQLQYFGTVEALMEYDGWMCITTEDGIAFVSSEYLSTEEEVEAVLDVIPDNCTLVPLGSFKITHYCCEKYKHICGTGTGLTASGLPVTPGMIATDPRVIPTGSKIMINGEIHTACDTGSMIKGSRIDIAVDTHKHALEAGTYYTDVYLVVEEQGEENEEADSDDCPSLVQIQ